MASASKPLIVLQNVSKTYRLEDGSSMLALDDASVDIGDQEFISFIGPSGCGKSTTLSLIAGLLEPTSGEVLIDGRHPSQARQGRQIGIVFQQPVLLPWRTIRRNCSLLLEVAGKRSREIDQSVEELLAIVGLSDFADRYPHQLSGGMRQRASIARALCLDPLLLLMDEPFGALDEFTRHQMNTELLKIWSRRRKTVVFVTHNIAEAVYMSDRVIAMSPRPGRIVEELAIRLDRPRTSEVRYTPAFSEYVIHLQQLLERDAAKPEL